MSQQMIPIWSPSDYRQVSEQAATLHETQCPAALTMHGERFGCDNPDPQHVAHTSQVLKAAWVDGGVA